MSVNMSLMKVGPAGGTDKTGIDWDEKGKGQIAKIFVSHNKNGIHSLQFLFVENGNFVLSDRHGAAAHDTNFNTVVFDYPSEFLTWIRGYLDLGLNMCDEQRTYLASITFRTNKGTYGPYGMKNIKLRELNFHIGDDGSFGGFYGTKHGNDIGSIGVYLNTITSSMINTPKNPRVKVKRKQPP